MTPRAETIIYPVKDLTRAKDVFRRLLGTGPVVDEPYYVQFEATGQAVGLDPHGHEKGMTGPVVYWHVEDLRSSVAALVDAGAAEREAVRDVGGGRRIASVSDPEGNVIGLLQDP